MVRYPEQNLEVQGIPLAALAMDTIGHLPITSNGNKWALTAICLHTSYTFTVPMKEKSAENVVQAFLSGILSHKGGSVAILSDNGKEFKNKVLMRYVTNWVIKGYFLTPSTLKVKKRWKMYTIS